VPRKTRSMAETCCGPIAPLTYYEHETKTQAVALDSKNSNFAREIQFLRNVRKGSLVGH
jgi:hypothetical protein